MIVQFYGNKLEFPKLCSFNKDISTFLSVSSHIVNDTPANQHSV